MIRRLALAAGAAAALVLSVGAPALASGSPNAADNSHFSLTYTEGTLSSGPVTWTCSGERIDNNGVGVTEQETCKLSGPGTSAYVPGDYGTAEAGTGFPARSGPFPGFPSSFVFFWFSDFNGQNATTWSVKVNGASNSAHVSATYN